MNFSLCLEEEWVETTAPHGTKKQFQDKRTESLTMLFTDMIFRDDDRFRSIVEEYAQDNDLFLEDFRSAWIKLVNADRFGDVCVTSEEAKMPEQKVDMTEPKESDDNSSNQETNFSSVMVLILLAGFFLTIVAQFAFMYKWTRKQSTEKAIELSDYPSKSHIGGSAFDVEEK